MTQFSIHCPAWQLPKRKEYIYSNTETTVIKNSTGEGGFVNKQILKETLGCQYMVAFARKCGEGNWYFLAPSPNFSSDKNSIILNRKNILVMKSLRKLRKFWEKHTQELGQIPSKWGGGGRMVDFSSCLQISATGVFDNEILNWWIRMGYGLVCRA